MELRNLLIVEDDEEWRDAYSRNVARAGAFRVKVAESLISAKALIDEMQFAVAFIDIGLDVNDDQNVDGLLVMDKIRSIDEETSIVVITGRSGRDVMPITKAALKQFKAFDIVAKSSTEPAEVHSLLKGGLAEYEMRLRARPSGRTILRGSMHVSYWDDEMLRATHAKGGMRGFCCFVDRLLDPFLPIVPVRTGDVLRCDATTGLAHGAYWSRAFGQPFVVCFGPEEKCAGPIVAASADRTLLQRYAVGELLAAHVANGVAGCVFSLRDASRGHFAAEAGD